MTNFITIGSCLAYNIGFCYRQSTAAAFISSTRHTRIDKLVDTYLEEKLPEISYEYVLNLDFDRSNQELVQLVDNQFISRDLGKTSLNEANLTNLVDTVRNEQIDLVIYDNFMDVLGKLIYSKADQLGFFINTLDVSNWEDFFTLESGRITIDLCLAYYEKMTRFFKQKNPDVKIVFANFPLMHKHEMAKTRVLELNEKYLSNDFLKENSFFIPAMPVAPEFLENAHHFKEYKGRNLYKNYALLVKLITDNYYSQAQWYELINQQQDSLLDFIENSSLSTSTV
ncbi:hypothetical protein NIES4102_07890 [Chondrocystis sp. NIES-4102]|nr:hypothetical protein NIES4102_07890 [Chondrocystis sp. NIES-4102]